MIATESSSAVRQPVARRLPVGAEPAAGGVHFRVWAPARRQVDVVVEQGAGTSSDIVPLEDEGGGYWSGLAPGARPGARYWYRLDGEHLRPDPASRFQPDGPHGPSQVVDPDAYRWRDGAWRGVSLRGQVIYELHLGTFTQEGTWRAAMRELGPLADLGVTCLEVMPVAEFPGAFGWGYDGVDLYAPSRLYGTPDDMRAFVDAAHALGVGVILDVVYNHLGPDGCYLRDFSPDYFTDRYDGEWGDPPNFDGPGSAPVRELFVENAGYWISEFHLDGLRLDATQSVFDASPVHVLAEIAQRVRAAASGRGTILVAENEPQQVKLIGPVERGGYGHDALWNDDFHHSAMVALTGRSEAYYSDHRGTPQELVSAAKHGFLFQGQRYAWQEKPRGTVARGVAPPAFVCFLENHDQVANSASGARLADLTSPGRLRAMTTLFLLGPWTPMLFQGQEHGARQPFLFFADHAGELAHRVRRGRAGFLRQFPTIAAHDMRDRLDDPGAEATFARCRLDPAERRRGNPTLLLHRDLLELRRADPVLRAQGEHGIDGAVLGPEALLLRWLAPDGLDRVLLVNLGADLRAGSVAEPLFAPPPDHAWTPALSSEAPRYGGRGSPEPVTSEGFTLLGHSAVLLVPVRVGGDG